MQGESGTEFSGAARGRRPAPLHGFRPAPPGNRAAGPSWTLPGRTRIARLRPPGPRLAFGPSPDT